VKLKKLFKAFIYKFVIVPFKVLSTSSGRNFDKIDSSSTSGSGSASNEELPEAEVRHGLGDEEDAQVPFLSFYYYFYLNKPL
jgi:hypothetical protein